MPALVSRQRAGLAMFVLLLVIVAFAGAYLASSTGIRMVGTPVTGKLGERPKSSLNAAKIAQAAAATPKNSTRSTKK